MRMRPAAAALLSALLLACLPALRGDAPALPLCNATHAGLDCALSPAFLARSVLHVGRLELPRLRAGRCLRVAVLGGSVACGQGSGGPASAWPARLAEALNAFHPCAADAEAPELARHEVANLCVKAVASDFWADRVAGWRANASAPGAAELHAAHLVLLELAVNDLANTALDLTQFFGSNGSNAAEAPGDRTTAVVLAHTELLLLLLRSLPRAPAVAYVGASSRGHRADERCGWRGDPRRCTAIALHARVARAYDAPCVSVTDAAAPLGSNASRAWYWDAFRQPDCCHPTRYGQTVVARMVLHGIELATSAAGLDGVLGDWAPAAAVDGVAAAEVAALRAPPTPLFASRALVELYRNAWPLHIAASLDARDARFRQPPTPAADGWGAAAEAGKPGVVATAKGAALTYNVSAADVAAHARSGALHAHVLKSYEHVGAARLDVCACGGRCDAADGAGALASRALELTWQAHASETAVEELRFDAAAFAASRAPCMLLRLTVTSDRPAADNRVKLVGLTLM